jgi:hypothetical protein
MGDVCGSRRPRGRGFKDNEGYRSYPANGTDHCASSSFVTHINSGAERGWFDNPIRFRLIEPTILQPTITCLYGSRHRIAIRFLKASSTCVRIIHPDSFLPPVGIVRPFGVPFASSRVRFN